MSWNPDHRPVRVIYENGIEKKKRASFLHRRKHGFSVGKEINVQVAREENPDLSGRKTADSILASASSSAA